MRSGTTNEVAAKRSRAGSQFGLAPSPTDISSESKPISCGDPNSPLVPMGHSWIRGRPSPR